MKLLKLLFLSLSLLSTTVEGSQDLNIPFFDQTNNGLRPYQQKCVEKILDFFKTDQKHGYVKMATGTGKTRTFVELIKWLTTNNLSLKTLVVVPKLTLVDQTLGVFQEQAQNLKTASYDSRFHGVNENVLVTTYNSFRVGENYQSLLQDIGLLILDESHFSLSGKNVEMINSLKDNPNLRILGFTATDEFNTARTGENLEKVKELLPKLIFEYSLQEGLESGVLAPYEIFKLKLSQPDLFEPIKKRVRGDLTSSNDESNELYESQENLEEIEKLNTLFPNLIQNQAFGENGLKDTQGLIFTTSIKHAESLAQKLNQVFEDDDYAAVIHSGLNFGVNAERILRHQKGDIRVLVNVSVLAEGYDNDQIQYLIDFNPTKSALRMMQIFGRLTRKNNANPEVKKKYIQLIIPESHQLLLEDILEDAGVKNIPVYKDTAILGKLSKEFLLENDFYDCLYGPPYQSTNTIITLKISKYPSSTLGSKRKSLDNPTTLISQSAARDEEYVNQRHIPHYNLFAPDGTLYIAERKIKQPSNIQKIKTLIKKYKNLSQNANWMKDISLYGSYNKAFEAFESKHKMLNLWVLLMQDSNNIGSDDYYKSAYNIVEKLSKLAGEEFKQEIITTYKHLMDNNIQRKIPIQIKVQSANGLLNFGEKYRENFKKDFVRAYSSILNYSGSIEGLDLKKLQRKVSERLEKIESSS